MSAEKELPLDHPLLKKESVKVLTELLDEAVAGLSRIATQRGDDAGKLRLMAKETLNSLWGEQKAPKEGNDEEDDTDETEQDPR